MRQRQLAHLAKVGGGRRTVGGRGTVRGTGRFGTLAGSSTRFGRPSLFVFKSENCSGALFPIRPRRPPRAKKWQDQLRPQRIPAFLKLSVSVSSIALGQYHALALTRHNKVFQWGQVETRRGDTFEECTFSSPTYVEGLLKGLRVVQVQCGSADSYVRSHAGEVFGWSVVELSAGQNRMVPAVYQFRAFRQASHFSVLSAPCMQVISGLAQDQGPQGDRALPPCSYAQPISPVHSLPGYCQKAPQTTPDSAPGRVSAVEALRREGEGVTMASVVGLSIQSPVKDSGPADEGNNVIRGRVWHNSRAGTSPQRILMTTHSTGGGVARQFEDQERDAGEQVERRILELEKSGLQGEFGATPSWAAESTAQRWFSRQSAFFGSGSSVPPSASSLHATPERRWAAGGEMWDGASGSAASEGLGSDTGGDRLPMTSIVQHLNAATPLPASGAKPAAAAGGEPGPRRERKATPASSLRRSVSAGAVAGVSAKQGRFSMMMRGAHGGGKVPKLDLSAASLEAPTADGLPQPPLLAQGDGPARGGAPAARAFAPPARAASASFAGTGGGAPARAAFAGPGLMRRTVASAPRTSEFERKAIREESDGRGKAKPVRKKTRIVTGNFTEVHRIPSSAQLQG